MVKIIGRTAGGLALVSVAALLVILVLLGISGAGSGNSVEDTPIGRFVLGVALPIFGGAAILSLLLALLNAIGIQPWFDPNTAAFVRPSSATDWATKIGGLAAGLALPITLGAVTVGVAVLVATGVDPNDWSGPLIAILIGGMIGTLVVAGIAGGIAVMGWFGIVAGLLLGAGLVGVVEGPMSGVPAATVLGAVAIGLSVACYYAGARFEGTIPSGPASYAASGGFAVLGIGFFVVSGLSHDLLFVIGGVAAFAATAGYLIGGLLGRIRSATAPALAQSTQSAEQR